MIRRLVDALRLLAAPAGEQVAEPAGWFAGPHRIAGELADALLLVDSCQQEMMEPAARAVLARLEEALEALPAGAWTGAAILTAPDWAEVRRLAADALRALGQE